MRMWKSLFTNSPFGRRRARLRHSAAALFVVVLGVVVVMGCSLIKSFDGFEDGHGVAVSGDEIRSDGQAQPPPDGSSACLTTSWPAQPVAGDALPDIEVRTYASRSMAILTAADSGAPPVGLNLDGLCTCPDRPACQNPANPNTRPACDAPQTGVDNAGAGIFAQLKATGADLDDTGLAAGIQQGQFALLVRLAGYNGTANDNDVSVSILDGFQLEGGRTGPAFDGNDVWRIDSDSVLEGFRQFTSVKAWVAASTLVAEIPFVIIKLRVPTGNNRWQLVRVEMKEVRLVGRLEGDSVLDNTIIGGRLLSQAALKQLQINAICKGTPTYETFIKPALCSARDLPKLPGNDGKESTRCEAISVGFRFRGERAKIGETIDAGDIFGCPLVDDDCSD